MKVRNIIIAATICLFAVIQTTNAIMPFESRQTEWQAKTPEVSTDEQATGKAPFSSETSKPLYAPPPGTGGGDAQKELPVGNGIWILMGLAIVYGIADKKFRKDKR